MKCFGFGLLNYKVWTSNSVKGISVKTMELFLLTFAVRLISILRHQGYLPFDKTGDWFYHLVEGLSVVGVSIVLFAAFNSFKSTYDEKYDLFGNLSIPPVFGVVYLVVPCLIVAILFHP